jgi:hypothetical protein
VDEIESDELNRRAFLALRGFSRSIAGDLIALLRSSEPIAPEVRDELADALDAGTLGGVRLTASGNADGANGAAAADAQRAALRVIAFIEDAKSSDSKMTDAKAMREATKALAMSEGKVKEAWQELRPRFRHSLAMIERGPMWATLDQSGRESWAMSFAYGQVQQMRKARRKPHRGIRSA